MDLTNIDTDVAQEAHNNALKALTDLVVVEKHYLGLSERYNMKDHGGADMERNIKTRIHVANLLIQLLSE